MSSPRWIPAMVAGLSLTHVVSDEACAQAIGVQQPVVQRFGVRTTVSVPDGGAALLGSVGSAAEFRRRSGLMPLGSSIGRQVAHAGLSVHVTVHDFAAMDAALLSAADYRLSHYREPSTPSGMVERAREQLLLRHRQLSSSPSSLGSTRRCSQAAAVSDPVVSRFGRSTLR